MGRVGAYGPASRGRTGYTNAPGCARTRLHARTLHKPLPHAHAHTHTHIHTHNPLHKKHTPSYTNNCTDTVLQQRLSCAGIQPHAVLLSPLTWHSQTNRGPSWQQGLQGGGCPIPMPPPIIPPPGIPPIPPEPMLHMPPPMPLKPCMPDMECLPPMPLMPPIPPPPPMPLMPEKPDMSMEAR